MVTENRRDAQQNEGPNDFKYESKSRRLMRQGLDWTGHILPCRVGGRTARFAYEAVLRLADCSTQTQPMTGGYFWEAAPHPPSVVEIVGPTRGRIVASRYICWLVVHRVYASTWGAELAFSVCSKTARTAKP